MLVASTINTEKVRRNSLVDVVEGYVFEQISSGKIGPTGSVGPVEKIAKDLKVSESTVQQALQSLASKNIVVRKPRHGTFVHPDGVQNVSVSSSVFSLILPDVVRPNYIKLLRAFQDKALEESVDVVVSNTDDDVDLYINCLKRQIANRAYGIVLIPPLHSSLPFSVIADVVKNDIPVVCCFRSAGFAGWPLILNDLVNNSYSSTKHLLDIGCRRVAFIDAHNYDANVPRDWFRRSHYGYLKAISSVGFALPDRYVAIGYTTIEQDSAGPDLGGEKLKQFLIDNPDIDGICTPHDGVAAMVIRILGQLGRNVPNDVAVCGGGNFSDYLGFERDFITTFEGNKLLVEKAFELLSSIKNGEKVPWNTEIELKCSLKVGKSTSLTKF